MGFHLNHSNNNNNNLSFKNQSNYKHWSELLSLIKSLAIFFSIALLLRASVVQAFKIPSSSMEPTLEIGDHILVFEMSYGLRLPLVDKTVLQFSEPRRGDVVVFTLPDDPGTNIIKRVIGLPGDEVEVRGREVFINKELYKEDHYARWYLGGLKDFGPIKVPEGKVFLLGDNRDHSRDSRYWENDHFLEMSRIKGKAFIIYWNSQLAFRRMFDVIR